jgi:glycosyltransferase involved in cell wall biosynthesis/predicted metal-dependent phosphoesterase TrpH
MNANKNSRADLHCHSTASEQAKLGVQRAVGLPECATPPEEVYALAKRRGMDFVTITDHDTIDGALELAGRPDCFVSEELTAWFKDEPQAVHVLCWGITPDDHEWLQAHSGDVELCAAYLQEHEIASALAHPFYAVSAPLDARHRRRLAELFPVWETRNGSRPPELNAPAAMYIDTHGGTSVAGSDDHAGVDVGRTFTETPPADTPESYLEWIRLGETRACGDEGSAAKWAHAAIALAARVVGRGDGPAPDPRAVLAIATRVISEGGVRSSEDGQGLGPDDARALLRGWLESMALDVDERGLIELMQEDGFRHQSLERRARRRHERGLGHAVDELLAALIHEGDHGAAIRGLFEACTPAIPYAPARAFLANERTRLASRGERPPRVAIMADGVGGMHGVTHTLDQIRERGVPGFDVEVVGTDHNVDRRLPAVPDIDLPFYEGLKLGVPSLTAISETLAEGRYDLVHLCAPGPAGIGAALVAGIMGLPTLASYHTELTAYAKLRTGGQRLEGAMQMLLAAFYGRADHVLSPSRAADRSLEELGVPRDSRSRWERGVDLARFSPAMRVEGALPGEISVLYAGRLSVEKGVDLLADAFLAARARDPRLRLVLAGGGPDEARLRMRVGEAGTFLGWLEGEDLARAYASADIFLFASSTDTFGQVILEAQASGLPVVAVGEGGPAELVHNGRTGLLRPPDADALALALLELSGNPARRARLGAAALQAAEARGWDRALGQLAAGYAKLLAAPARPMHRAA